MSPEREQKTSEVEANPYEIGAQQLSLARQWADICASYCKDSDELAVFMSEGAEIIIQNPMSYYFDHFPELPESLQEAWVKTLDFLDVVTKHSEVEWTDQNSLEKVQVLLTSGKIKSEHLNLTCSAISVVSALFARSTESFPGESKIYQANVEKMRVWLQEKQALFGEVAASAPQQ